MDYKSFDYSRKACYSLAHSLATKDVKQSTLINALHDTEKNYEGNLKETILQMINVFHDGLAYGNWPKEK